LLRDWRKNSPVFTGLLFGAGENHRPVPANPGTCDQWLFALSKTLIREGSFPAGQTRSTLGGCE
jgi:hypothetical protein